VISKVCFEKLCGTQSAISRLDFGVFGSFKVFYGSVFDGECNSHMRFVRRHRFSRQFHGM